MTTPVLPPIRKAVFPVAGLGTRFLPATKVAPKEMLPVVNKPLIQYAVEEAYAAGIREMIFVTSHNKRAIEDHFDIAHELENELRTNHANDSLLSTLRSVTPSDMECFSVRQSAPLGLGHAILCAENIVGNEPFAVILADDLIINETPAIQQLIHVYQQYGHSVVATEGISMEQTESYGIIQSKPWHDNVLKVEHIVEKPKPQQAASNQAVVGRYVFTPQIFEHIKTTQQDSRNEIQITDAINKLLNEEIILALPFEGQRYDCGSVLGFLKANVVLGKQHPVEGGKFSEWLLQANSSPSNPLYYKVSQTFRAFLNKSKLFRD